MKKNIGTTDKVIRLLIALIILVLYFAGAITGVPSVILFIVAALAILTSILGVCPVYLVFGLSTLKPENKDL